MSKSPDKTWSRLSFRQQLVLTFSLGISCLAITSSLVISSVSNNTVYEQMLNEGRQVTEAFAEQATLSLLYRSPDSAEESAQSTLAFPDVAGVTIYTPDRNTLYHFGASNPATDNAKNLPVAEQIYTENDDAWFFSAPVYAGETLEEDVTGGGSPFDTETSLRELIGFVEVVVSKDSLKAMSVKILRSNLLVAGGLSIFLLPLLLMITRHVTQPIKNLAQIMGRAEQGQTDVRAQLQGPKDIIEMETAFNTMMSELQSREQELKRARDTALASAQVKGEFAATVSHELRTPMNGIMGMLELLHGMGLSDKQEEYIKVARTSGESLLALIDDILDFSKIESGKMKLHLTDIDPREMLQDIVELLTTQARQRDVTLHCDTAAPVPASMRGDSGRIRQVLINLTGNAIKFTEHGSVTLRLSLRASDNTLLNDAPEELYFEVEDTGIGIPVEAQQRIFEAFAQADSSTTRKYGGTGLGLAICGQLVELMGGNIGVHSQPGQGSTFWFSIPLEAGVGAVPVREIDHTKLVGLRILLVGNDAEPIEHLEKSLLDWETFHRTTSNGQTGLSALQAAAAQGRPFDLVIIDTPIDDLSITEFIERMHSEETLRKTHIILLGEPTGEAAVETASATWLPRQPQALALFDAIDQQLSKRPAKAPRKVAPAAVEAAVAATVLIAEDNTANQQVALGMLERLGHTGHLAGDGEEAITLLQQQHFDLVLMDCIMPGMDGYEATRLIRREETDSNRIPIIAMTANVGPSDRQRCLDAGMDDYLTKPVNLADLQTALGNWLGQAAAPADEPAADMPAATQTVDSTGTAPQPDTADIEQLPTLDTATIDKLRELVGKRFQAMLEAFLEDTPRHIENLKTAVNEEDAGKIHALSHSITGSANNLGAVRLARFSRDLEQLGAARQMAGTGELAAQIECEYRSLVELLTQQLAQQPLQETAPSEQPPAIPDQHRILVVDDESSARLALHGILERDGYAISEAKNGAEAVAACKRQSPDLVLMDAMMPDMDGFTACQRIQTLELPSTPPILMVTALQDEESIERAFASGATDFIPKPVNLTVLRQRIARLLKTNSAEKTAHQLAYYDSLTNLPNRTLFLERARELLQQAEAKQQMMALMFLDLDRFKLVNDTQGHDAGDLLLKTVSLRLQGSIRGADIVARLGGDDFTILLNDIESPETVVRVAEKICRRLVQPFAFLAQQVYVSASIGIALYPQNGGNIGTLMKHADTAMFSAKAKGGGAFQFYEYGMATEISRQLELESELRQALQTNELVLHYQPQMDLLTGKLVGMEALVRWQHPQRGLLPPSEFIPLAEQSGLINALGDWVLLHACRQQKAWLDQGIVPLPVAVNVSGRQLGGDVLFNKIKDILAETDIPHNLLKLELTEDTLADSNQEIVEQLQHLKSLGVTLAIDDFGTGYSSLSYLKQFPVDTLKIDRTFIKDLPDDTDSAAIAGSIIALGHRLGMKIVAEGVETEAQRDFLKREGCDVAQGYLLSRPLPKPELESWLQARVKEDGAA
ncbi:EAL domain-containing protein [Exilibacterium tricleocarpae]|nr:EAL domain-containing protein [Exilibacterium tricleocarpae]